MQFNTSLNFLFYFILYEVTFITAPVDIFLLVEHVSV